MADRLTLGSINRRVARGARWLESHGGEDWARQIIDADAARNFRMADPCRCAVGTVIGNYNEDYQSKSGEGYDVEGWEYGFDLPEPYDARTDARGYAALELAWLQHAQRCVGK